MDRPDHQTADSVATPLGAEHDLVPPLGRGRVVRPYLVCSTQRSGSGLLCRGLAGTGVAGTPTEYFSVENRRRLEARWRCDGSLDAYVVALLAHRSTGNGMFGSKLHWEHLQLMRAELCGEPDGDPGFGFDAGVLQQLLPGARYVRILRLDIDRQAISLWTAANRGVFVLSRSGDPSALPAAPYDFHGILRCRRMIGTGELHWDRFFRRSDIRPVEVVYEEFVADFEGTLRRVLSSVLPDGDGKTVSIPAPITSRLSDAGSEEMLGRFREELKRRAAEAPLGLATRLWRRLRR